MMQITESVKYIPCQSKRSFLLRRYPYGYKLLADGRGYADCHVQENFVFPRDNDRSVAREDAGCGCGGSCVGRDERFLVQEKGKRLRRVLESQ